MSADTLISQLALKVMLAMLDRLRAEPTPLPWGKAQMYSAFVPGKTPDEILAIPNAPYWWGYAETVREYTALLNSLPAMPFKPKKVSKS